MKHLILSILMSAAAFAQVATPLIVTPGSGSASSEIRLRERRSNGDNYFGWKSPSALAADVMLVGPIDYGTAGQALITDGAGSTSWGSVAGSAIPVCNSTTGNDSYACTVSSYPAYAACIVLIADTANTLTATVDVNSLGAQSILRYGAIALSTNDILVNTPAVLCYDGTQFQMQPGVGAVSGGEWVNGGNSFGADGTLGTNDTFAISFKTDNVNRWTIDATGNLFPATDNAYVIGGANRPSLIYSRGLDTAPSGTTGDYVRTRKLDLFDTTGAVTGATFWDMQCVVNGVGALQESYCYMRDNGGFKVWQSERVRTGAAVDRTYWYTDLSPDTTLGQNLGDSSHLWNTIYVDALGTDLFPVTDNAQVLGNGTKRWSNVRTVDLRADGNVTFSNGAANGYVWTSDAVGLGSWQPAGSILPVIDTQTLVKGSADATKLLRFEVDGFTTATTRVLTPQDADYTLAGINIAQTFSANQTFGANILFGADNTYDIGATGTRARAAYSRIFDTAASGITGDYVQTRKLNIFDNTGSTTAAAFWDLQCVVNGVGVLQESYCYMRDNGGNKVFQAERVRTGSPVDRTLWYTDLLPDTTLGQNLGSAANIWSTIYVDQIGTDLFPTVTDSKVLGNGTKRWSSIRTLDLRADGFVTFSAGAVNGYVWTSDASGVGSWQAVTAGLPVIDSTSVVKGSLDPTKLLRFEVDGFSTASTRVLTPQNANYTIAGTDISQTFSSTNTFSANTTISNGSSLLMDRATRGTNQKIYFTVAGNPSTTGAWSTGTVPAGAASTFNLAHNGTTYMSVDESGTLTWTGSGSFSSIMSAATVNATGNPAYRVGGTTIINSSREISNIAGVSTDFTPTFSGVYSLGTTSFRWGQVASTNMDVSNIFTISGTVTGNLNPTSSNTYAIGTSLSYWNMIRTESLRTHGGNVSPATSLVGSLGQSTARWSKTWTQDLDITGTIVPPSGSAFTGTKTVRDSAGTGTCTMTFSAGIMTGGTC